MNNILKLSHIGKTFTKGKNKLPILKNINLEINAGEIIALTGPSGSGKSTLLHISGLLDTPTHGHIYLNGKNVSKFSDKKRTLLRRNSLGFIYQSHLLLPDFTALENVLLPQLTANIPLKEAEEKAKNLLELVGLSQRIYHRSGQLSGGEQQRVAIARALANSPQLLLADEPTGNLDPITAENVFGLLLQIVKTTGLSAFIATHNPDIASRMHRQYTIKNGELFLTS